MNLKSAMYEDEFEGLGFLEWEPSKCLIDAGYIHDENFFKEQIS